MASFHLEIPNIVTLPVITKIDDAIDSICFRELLVTSSFICIIILYSSFVIVDKEYLNFALVNLFWLKCYIKMLL